MDHGYTVSVANSSNEAMEKLNTKPNLILLDINMPGMDGLELCKVIRNHIVCPIKIPSRSYTILQELADFYYSSLY